MICVVHSYRGRKIAALLATSSLMTLAGVTSAYAQPAGNGAAAAEPATPVEEVLVTGSLIHGTQAVGVPVTSLGAEDFHETGALTVSDLLRNVPSVQVTTSASTTSGGGNAERATGIDIHNLNAGSPRTLMLIDGMRYPLQTHDTSAYDPSIIPAIAVDRLDVLADGASATYGSDAVAGVVNVLLKRGFEGAVSEVRVGTAEGGGFNTLASQLFGTKWDSGDVTVSYEYYNLDEFRGPARDYITYDFTPWGLDNTTPILSSLPGTVSTGAPNARTGTGCTNCYAVPGGTGPTDRLNWTQLLANPGTNEVNPYALGDFIPATQRNAATITFDQNIIDGVQFFAEGFYSNRRSQQLYPGTITPYATANLITASVPTSNPYYPVGAPAGLRVSYNFARDIAPRLSSYEISSRYAGGFNLTLPGDWFGKIFFATNEEHGYAGAMGLVNANNLNAALGNTVAAANGLTDYTRPATVPALNLFCDASAYSNCNDPRTLAYIQGYRIYNEHYLLHDMGANFDGPLFALPGGDVRAAVGFDYNTHNYSFRTTQNYTTQSTALISDITDNEKRQVWATFGQVNVPIFGDANALPFLQKLSVEAAIRYDHYSDFGGTTNPKVSIDWVPVDGLTFRGSWGKSFRAPAFADFSPVAGKQVQGVNLAAGATSNSLPACNTVGGTPVAGSAAAILNPTCSAALQFPAGITSRGGTPPGYILFGSGSSLQPEKAKNYTLGFDYAPTNFFSGLDIYATYFHTVIDGALQGFDTSVGAGLNDPTTRFTYILPDDPNFANYVHALYTDPNSTITGPESSIQFINVGNIRNTGSVKVEGMDFGVGYNWDWEDFGVWNTGVAGTYFFHRDTVGIPGTPAQDSYDVSGTTQEPRMKYRARLGWTNGTLSATGFMNYQSHFSSTEPFPPSCYISGAPCFPGAEQFPNFSTHVPAFYTFDLSLGYNTGDTPANTYLRNLNVQLVTNNVFDKDPPFSYKTSRTGGTAAYLGSYFNPLGRTISLTFTKSW